MLCSPIWFLNFLYFKGKEMISAKFTTCHAHRRGHAHSHIIRLQVPAGFDSIACCSAFNMEVKRTVFAFNLSRSKQKRNFILGKVKYRSETNSTSVKLVKIEAKSKRKWIGLVKHFMRAKEKGTKVNQRSKRKQVGLVFNFARTKQSETEFLPCQLRSKNDQVVPKFWKNKVKRRDLAQHFQSRR